MSLLLEIDFVFLTKSVSFRLVYFCILIDDLKLCGYVYLSHVHIKIKNTPHFLIRSFLYIDYKKDIFEVSIL